MLATRTALVSATFALLATPALTQTVDPPGITSDPSPTCGGGTESYQVCLTLPDSSTDDNVDVLFFFDDTGSFAAELPTAIGLFEEVVARLQLELPGVSLGFGVARFEEYGGPGNGFGNDTQAARPFTLNQAILASDFPTFAQDIQRAFMNNGPGGGGDGPETSVNEGLLQIATGVGFDGNGNGSTLDSGPAGALDTQINPGISGDVPPFSSYVGTASGSLGGVGWRPGARKIVLLATDSCTVAPFEFPDIPANIVGAGSVEPVSVFACSSTTPGSSRFGFVSDSLFEFGGTIPNSVAPLGAGTIPQAIASLGSLGIKIIGLSSGGGPTSSPGPSFDESVYLSALARLTGALDPMGQPLVFDVFGDVTVLLQAIIDAIATTAMAPIDVAMTPEPLLPGLTVDIVPPIHFDVAPGDTVCWDVTLTGDVTFAGNESFNLTLRDTASNAIVGVTDVRLACPAECFLVVSGSTGGTSFDADGHVWQTQLGPIREYHAVTMEELVDIPLPPVDSGGGPGRPFERRVTPVMELVAQVLMWNPDVFPGNPEQWTHPVEIIVWSNGRVTQRELGTRNGMTLWATTFVDQTGQRYLRLPFQIDGLQTP